MSRSIVLVIVAAFAAAIVGGSLTAVAQEGPPPATNIVVTDSENPGEVIVTWDAVPEATYYRIASVNMDTDYPLALASPTGNWLAAFIYADVDAGNFVGDRPSYTIRRLEQGALHAFLVGTNTSLFGQPTWPADPVWQLWTVADHTAEPTPTPTPEPTPTPVPSPVDVLEPVVRAVLVRIVVGGAGSASSATGLIVSADGLVVTNRSAIGGAETVRAHWLSPSGDSREFTGQVLGRDILSDLALIRLDATRNFTPLDWAETGDVAVGLEAIAWGYPPGDIARTLPNATRGTVASRGNYHDAAGFQTNAVNPVNSGGPLTDAEGNVIGVNVAPGDGGVPFAIASDHVARLVDTLSKGDPESAAYRASRFGYGYRADIPAGWHLASESAEITEFEHPERKAYFAIAAHDLSSDPQIASDQDPLEAFAERRQEELAQEAETEGWRLYEETAFERIEAEGIAQYRLEYHWARDPRHCTASDAEVIVLASSYPDPPYGFVAVGGTCEDTLDVYGEAVQQMLAGFVP